VWNLDSDLFWIPEVVYEAAALCASSPHHVYLLPVANVPCGVEYARFSLAGDALPASEWVAGWPERAYPIDMGAFIFHSSHLLQTRRLTWQHVGVGGESEFVQELVRRGGVTLRTLARFLVDRPLRLEPHNEFPVFWNGITFKEADLGAGSLLSRMSVSSPTSCAEGTQRERRRRRAEMVRHLVNASKRKLVLAPQDKRIVCRMTNHLTWPHRGAVGWMGHARSTSQTRD